MVENKTPQCRRLCRRHRLLGPGRAGRSGQPHPLAGLGAQALHLWPGLRQSDPASGQPHAGCAHQLRRLCAQGFRRHVPGRGDGARCAADVAEHSRRDGAGPGRAAGLHPVAAECRRASGLSHPRCAQPAGGAGRAGHLALRHRHALCRDRRRRHGAGPALCRRTRRTRRAIDCSVRWRPGICATCWTAWRCPMAGRWGRGCCRTRSIGFKTGTSYGYPRCLGGGLFQRLHRGGVGGPRRRHAASRPCRPRSGRADPAQDVRTAAAGHAVPRRRFRRARCWCAAPTNCRPACATSPANAPRPRPVQTAQLPPPAIAFPPNGAVVPLPDADAKDPSLQFKADGGRSAADLAGEWRAAGQLRPFRAGASTRRKAKAWRG